MTCNIKKISILGERCSGTNFLEETMINNFNIQYTGEYGNKHFFCYHNYDAVSTDDTLFIGIIRNPIYWLNSFSKELYHIPEINRKNLNSFLFNEFYSVIDEIDPTLNNNNNIFIMNNKYYTYKYKTNYNDLNYITGKKYKNIFELRNIKNDYLIRIMPKKVKNYILINYEDLLYNHDYTLNKIKQQFNLIPKNETFQKIKKYKKSDTYNFVVQRQISFSVDNINLIWKHLNVNQEAYLGYFIRDDNNFFKYKKENKNDNILKNDK